MVSIILGLSLARLLGGTAIVVREFNRTRLFLPHSLWIVYLLLLHSLQWWSIWDYHEIEWNYCRFFFVNTAPLALFFISSLIFPSFGQTGTINLREHFFRIRIGLFGAALFATIIWILDGPLIFQSEPLWNVQRLVQVPGLLLLLWGLGSKSVKVHSVVAWVALIGTLFTIWNRFSPGAFAPGP
jgi:hypothetical protein